MANTLSPALLQMVKLGFVPPGAGGDPAAAGGDPAAAGGMPPGGMSPGGMPPGGDPMAAAGGAPPTDPMAAAGGAPPPPMDPTAGGGIQGIIQQTIQQVMQAQQGGGAVGAAAGGKKSSGKVDEVAQQLYKMNVLLTAMIVGMQKADIEIVIPPNMLLGPPPGSDPNAAMAMSGGPGGMTDPAASGQDPNAMPPGGAAPADPAQQQMNFMPAIAPPGGAAGGAPPAQDPMAGKTAAQRIGTPISMSGKQASTQQTISASFGVNDSVMDNALATLELLAAVNRNRQG